MTEPTRHEYDGYFRTLILTPDPEAIAACPNVTFTPEEIAHWNLRDVPSEREWERIPASRVATPDGVRLTGRFEDIRKIDHLEYDDPSFWVPLGTIGLTNPKTPVDLLHYPVLEITYRCLTQHARPAWTWHHGDAVHFDWLPHSKQWLTRSRLIPHFGFPTHVDRIVVRLYSPSRTTESLEIASIRFRAMTQAESDAVRASEDRLQADIAKQPTYPILDEFMPFGTYLDAHVAKSLAKTLNITLDEYWTLAFDDLVRHNHNCAIIERAESLDDGDWRKVFAIAGGFDIKLLPVHKVSFKDGHDDLRNVLEKRIAPLVTSSAVMAWSFCDEPAEEDFGDIMTAKQLLHEVDPNHPMFAVSRFASTYPLYGAVLPAAAMAYYTSHAPWEIGDVVRSYATMSRNNRFWLSAPGFVYATGTPEWSSCPEMRLLMNASIANGARGWFTYAYHNEPIWEQGSCQRSLVGPFLSFSDLWLELDRRLEVYDALAPLLLNAKPSRLPSRWFAVSKRSEDAYQFPEGVEPTGSYRLRGPDYNLYFIVSNDIRGMASVNVDIPAEAMKGLFIYDLTDCVRGRKWVPMDLSRHWEMFPGQARVLFVAERNVCDHWRDILFDRLRNCARRVLQFDLKLAKTYGLDIREIEALIHRASAQNPIDGLETMDRAYALLFDKVYTTPVITQARSKIIEVSAMVCACDGALCRLLDKGKGDTAQELGRKVGPLASEFTRFRLDLRQGKAASVIEHSDDLSRRTAELLKAIRSHT